MFRVRFIQELLDIIDLFRVGMKENKRNLRIGKSLLLNDGLLS